jgi:hypothetical protein
MTFIAGPFTVEYGSGVSVGQARDLTIEWFENGQPILGDNFGLEIQDEVLQGIEVFVELTLLEWDITVAQELYWPFHATLGTGPVIGSLNSTIAYKSLILTAAAGTTAFALSAQNVWTFPLTKLAKGFPVRILTRAVNREIVLRLRVYPNATNVFFVVS